MIYNDEQLNFLLPVTVINELKQNHLDFELLGLDQTVYKKFVDLNKDNYVLYGKDTTIKKFLTKEIPHLSSRTDCFDAITKIYIASKPSSDLISFTILLDSEYLKQNIPGFIEKKDKKNFISLNDFLRFTKAPKNIMQILNDELKNAIAGTSKLIFSNGKDPFTDLKISELHTLFDQDSFIETEGLYYFDYTPEDYAKIHDLYDALSVDCAYFKNPKIAFISPNRVYIEVDKTDILKFLMDSKSKKVLGKLSKI